jgi:hypothetical protein
MTDETLEILWKNVVDHWDDDAAHQAFLQHCQSTEKLGEAAGRYAEMKRDAARGPSAQKRLETVAALATALLQASRGPRSKARRRGLVVLTVAVFGSMALYAVLRVLFL